jgi:pyruvate dehydrogenase E2 component (dihydrolipoamide acetyltransferase)
MAQIIPMPKLSDTMEEGGIASWFVKEGDYIEEGDVICEIETDKATMEFASPEEGYLLKIMAQKGQSMSLGQPICVLGSSKDEKYDLSSSASASVETKKSEELSSVPVQTSEEPSKVLPEKKERIIASPLAKKIAQDKGVDLALVQGSGPRGRIVAIDLKKEGPAEVKAITSQGVKTGETPSSTQQKMPLSQMRKTIVKRLVAAKNEAPHFYLTTSVSMDALLNMRKHLNDEASDGVKVSVNDMILQCVAKALKKHPYVNASFGGDHILLNSDVHVCMAVALEAGLITPVVRHTDRLGLYEMAKVTKDLGARAKDGKLTPEEYTGGTFTVSNLGMSVVDSFTAIINPPQSAILAVGRAKKLPSVLANGQLGIETRMSMTLSCDHRVIDGMVGAQFLEDLVKNIENPLRMLS